MNTASIALNPIISAIKACDEAWEEGVDTGVSLDMVQALTTFGLLEQEEPNHWVVSEAGRQLLEANRQATSQVYGKNDPSMQPGYPGDAAIAQAFRVVSARDGLVESQYTQEIVRMARELAEQPTPSEPRRNPR